MLLPVLNDIYNDAMIINELRDVIKKLYCVEVTDAMETWKCASEKIELLIPKLGDINMESAENLLEMWKHTREQSDDIRDFAFRIEYALIPAVSRALPSLYSPLRLRDERYIFETTLTGFITVRDTLKDRYLHSPIDPMQEASELADKIYDPQMDSFHILGCGLGYLAYQIWEKSDRTAHIYIYEEDRIMLEYADQIGVLSWIDAAYLTIADSSDIRRMLLLFWESDKQGAYNRYVSDWKIGVYEYEIYGIPIDMLDFNERTRRSREKSIEINVRENRKLAVNQLSKIKKDYDFEKKECVVVSAGPSFNDNIEFLRDSVGKRVIIAINTALCRLVSEGIRPDLVVMLDPLPTLSSHIKGIEDATEGVPLIFPLSGSQSFTRLFRGPKYVIDFDKKNDDAFEFNFGGTVASLGLDMAYYLNATRVYLVGSDLAYSDGVNYAEGVAHSTNEGISGGMEVEAADGGRVTTNYLYNSYREMIEGQIAAHANVPVVNMAKHGAKIKGTTSL